MPIDAVLTRYSAASAGFEKRLQAVRTGQWDGPTPCPEWSVGDLVNHMTRGNLNYVLLLRGGTARRFIELRDADALGGDPVGAYARSVRTCAGAFAEPEALERMVDYPLGRITARQALAVRTADTLVHTWDLARATGGDERLDPSLVAWLDDHLADVYAGLAETPIAAETTHRFFAAPAGTHDGSRQARLLHLMGRRA